MQYLVKREHMPEPVLRKSPLTSVVCELRFQPVVGHLEIVGLSKRLEEIGLTSYNREQGMQLQMGPGQLQQREVERHRFATAEGDGTLILDEGIFAFDTASYRGIDHFLETWKAIATAIVETFGVAARNRIGLRYVNEIRLPAPDRVSVEELIKDELVPPWGAQPHLEELSVSLHELRFKQDEGELTFRHGLQREPGADSVYLLDFDHYEQRLTDFDIEEEVKRLRDFNARVYEIFRWSITDESYAAFEPQKRPDA